MHETPFTAEIYYVNKISKLDMKWGTPDPIPLMDPKYNIQINVRSFGQYGVRVERSRKFVKEIVGALSGDQLSTPGQAQEYFNGVLINKVKDSLGTIIDKRGFSLFEVATKLKDLSDKCQERIEGEFERFGLELVNFFFKSINVPDEDKEKLRTILEKKAEKDMLGEHFKEVRSFELMEDAFKTEGAGEGTMDTGMGLGMGVGAGSALGEVLKDLSNQMKEDDNKSEIEQKNTVTCQNCQHSVEAGANFCPNCGEEILTEGKICPSCGAENPPGAKFCSKCGQDLQKVECPNCGNENKPGAIFCSECGEDLTEDQES